MAIPTYKYLLPITTDLILVNSSELWFESETEAKWVQGAQMTESAYGCTFKLVMSSNCVHQSRARGTLAAALIQNENLAIQEYSSLSILTTIFLWKVTP
jgi:hypothetical protein